MALVSIEGLVDSLMHIKMDHSWHLVRSFSCLLREKKSTCIHYTWVPGDHTCTTTSTTGRQLKKSISQGPIYLSHHAFPNVLRHPKMYWGKQGNSKILHFWWTEKALLKTPKYILEGVSCYSIGKPVLHHFNLINLKSVKNEISLNM